MGTSVNALVKCQKYIIVHTGVDVVSEASYLETGVCVDLITSLYWTFWWNSFIFDLCHLNAMLKCRWVMMCLWFYSMRCDKGVDGNLLCCSYRAFDRKDEDLNVRVACMSTVYCVYKEYICKRLIYLYSVNVY